MYYNFLILAILFSVPGIIIGVARPDLRQVIMRVVPFALPFALTEFLFYPDYWEPRFLFNLGARIGFGIEDFIFVAGLAAFTTTAYAAVCGRSYRQQERITNAAVAGRCGSVLLAAFALAGAAVLLEIPMIYGACAIMMILGFAILVLRRDLGLPSVAGGLLSMGTYYLICLCCMLLMPGLFRYVWHTERFLNIFIGGVPLEELAYGFSAGFCATGFYPFVFAQMFTDRQGGAAA
jgi:hypothetical protein